MTDETSIERDPGINNIEHNEFRAQLERTGAVRPGESFKASEQKVPASDRQPLTSEQILELTTMID